MPGLPEILNMLDEIRFSLDDPTKQVQQAFPLMFFGEHPVTFKNLTATAPPQCCPLKKPANNTISTKSKHPAADKDFSVVIDVSPFQPEEISVKVKDRDIIIEARHEEREDEHGFVSRQFTRRFMLPDEYDPDTISTYLNADGKMTVKALKPRPVEVEVKERIIPITRVSVSEAHEEETSGVNKKKDTEAESTVENGPKET